MEDQSLQITISRKREIGKNQYTEKRMSVKHALTLVQSTGNDLETEALAMKKLQDLRVEKQAIKNKAKQYLYTAILKKASELEMIYKDTAGDSIPVSNHKEISLSWKQDPSDSNAKILFEILFGQFERQSCYWRERMETEIMNELNLKYKEDDTKAHINQTGCVSKLITCAKTEIVKNINRVGKAHHGRSIGIANEKGTGKKSKRRKMGDFMKCFVKTKVKTEPCGSDLKVRKNMYLMI